VKQRHDTLYFKRELILGTPVPALINAFIQARMSSCRFPGKVLAPFRGQPLIKHVITAVRQALPSVQIIVATSTEESDAPLVAYLQQIGVTVFRGPLHNVFLRFRGCLFSYPSEWILRVSGDSPLLDARALQAVVSHANDSTCDLATTIHPRTFPRGHNTELIRASAFMSVNPEDLSPDDQAHVTPVFYRNPDRFRIVNVESGDPQLANLRLAVDTVEDLQRLERLSELELNLYPYVNISSRRIF
jgi:spore coat polysaccharide biosynthesis protein SpsF